jgi:hypothetical protein
MPLKSSIVFPKCQIVFNLIRTYSGQSSPRSNLKNNFRNKTAKVTKRVYSGVLEIALTKRNINTIPLKSSFAFPKSQIVFNILSNQIRLSSPVSNIKKFFRKNAEAVKKRIYSGVLKIESTQRRIYRPGSIQT